MCLHDNTTGNDNAATVLVRSKTTPPATATRPSVLMRYLGNTTAGRHHDNGDGGNTAVGYQAPL